MEKFPHFILLYVYYIYCMIYMPLCWCNFITVPLSGSWKILDGHEKYALNGTVPGNVYTALKNAGFLEDPYKGFNDDKYSWVADCDWTYTRTFTVTSHLLKKRRVLLVCDGLDSVGTIHINQRKMAAFDNMFVKYVYDIKSSLQIGVNKITIRFTSPTKYAKWRYSHLPYPIPPVTIPKVEQGRSHVNMLRKKQASFGWDWGPSFPTSGIWKPINIVGLDAAIIDTVAIETIPGELTGSWILRVELFLHVVVTDMVGSVVQLRLQTGRSLMEIRRNIKISNHMNPVTVDMMVSPAEEIRPWWPNGYGTQKLYRLDIVIITPQMDEISNRTIYVGFRTVELVQDPVGHGTKGQGLTFFFKINGLPIFLKGSNWIPADSFDDEITTERIKNLLQSAIAANMNTIRVWGGGIYEQDAFYDLADELGIVVWQDLMFVCAFYPRDEAFLATVKQEIPQQIRRLKRHPSIIVWDGNNEVEEAIAEDWYAVGRNITRYKADYIKLFIDTIRPLVTGADTSRPFLSSSPSNGLQTQKHGWISRNPQLRQFGDVHYYNYVSDLWNVSVLPTPRMVTEYGVQSWCSFKELEPVSTPTDWSFESKWSMHRQHHLFGNQQMVAAIARHFPLPVSNHSLTHYKHMIYLSQVNQAMSVRTETEHYRRSQSDLHDGYGYTMGALYWQLNDIWQAPSWSSIEYSGRWKMLHYFAEEFFAPSIISPYIINDTLKIYVIVESGAVSELCQRDSHRSYRESRMMDAVTKCGEEFQLILEMYSWANMTPLYTWTQPFTVSGIEETLQIKKISQLVYASPISTLMKTSGCRIEHDCFIRSFISGKLNIRSSWLPLSSFLRCEEYLPRANVKVTSVHKSTIGNFIIDLTTDVIAAFVWLESGDIRGRFSHNGFLMLTPRVTVTFVPWHETTTERLTSALTVMSLMDLY